MKLKGKGKFKDFLNKANGFLKKSQILSKLGGMYSKIGQVLPLPYAGTVGTAAGFANKLGYGKLGCGRKKRIRKGGSLRPAGARRGFGLTPSGGSRRPHMVSRRPMVW